MSFGHCGVDWLHTLFDSHPEILILPEISFYRIWKIIDGDSINTYNEVFLAFLNYLENHPYRAGEENKLFSSKGKKKIFFDRFKLNGLNNSSYFLEPPLLRRFIYLSSKLVSPCS